MSDKTPFRCRIAPLNATRSLTYSYKQVMADSVVGKISFHGDIFIVLSSKYIGFAEKVFCGGRSNLWKASRFSRKLSVQSSGRGAVGRATLRSHGSASDNEKQIMADSALGKIFF
ncbi:MAG: hypothetical protein WBA93_10690 [Microcoleaceae cyanobacterium]